MVAPRLLEDQVVEPAADGEVEIALNDEAAVGDVDVLDHDRGIGGERRRARVVGATT